MAIEASQNGHEETFVEFVAKTFRRSLDAVNGHSTTLSRRRVIGLNRQRSSIP